MNKIPPDRIITYLEKLALGAVTEEVQTVKTERIYDYLMGAAKLIEEQEATIERVRELREYWNTYAANNAKYGYDEYSKAVNTCGNDLNEALGDSEVGD